jgi:hypothetical protein
LPRDMSISYHDIRNMARKLTKETYIRHDNDIKGIRMFTEENLDTVFFMQHRCLDVRGKLTRVGIPFTLGIQTQW